MVWKLKSKSAGRGTQVWGFQGLLRFGEPEPHPMGLVHPEGFLLDTAEAGRLIICILKY